MPAFVLTPARRALRRSQEGIVLVMALIILVIVSLLAVMSMRNATSSDAVTGAVRTTSLATQAAEIALRYCEQSLISVYSVADGGSATFTTTFSMSNVQPYSSTPKWQSLTIWDSTSTATFVLGTTTVNQAGLTATFSRLPECMVEPVPSVANGTVSYTTAFVITARGFGPEVSAVDTSRSRPKGTEIWLQSTIEFTTANIADTGSSVGDHNPN